MQMSKIVLLRKISFKYERMLVLLWIRFITFYSLFLNVQELLP
jgi:hypothetical protein